MAAAMHFDAWRERVDLQNPGKERRTGQTVPVSGWAAAQCAVGLRMTVVIRVSVVSLSSLRIADRNGNGKKHY